MLFLSGDEKAHWRTLGGRVRASTTSPHDLEREFRPSLWPMFCFYAGTLLAADGEERGAMAWLVAGARAEGGSSLLTNTFALGFLHRQNGRFVAPEAAFTDPRPWVHFAGVPAMRSSRQRFIEQCGASLPRFQRPLRVLDIGCGDGGLLASLIRHLRLIGTISDVGEALLVDSSPAMVALARETLGTAVAPASVRVLNDRIEAVSAAIDGHFDVALMSASYHHMPWEHKALHLERLRPRVDHVLLFEVSANHDLPDLGSPELAASVYQTYGRLIDAVFAHDAPVELANACVDRFLMPEEVSLLTQPRGERTDYHMLRTQWHELFRRALGDEYSCWCDATAYADDFVELFTLHYGR